MFSTTPSKPPKPSARVTSTQLSSTKYAETRKELLQLVQKLRAIGAQAVVDVPRVVVIGNQSAGKSSVVEAISEITVPRDAGTCTRCPMECRMSSSTEKWSCQISIRWEYEADGQKKKDVSELPFGPRITDPGKVELALRRAQAAVLNPSVQSHDFLHMSAEQIKAGIKSNTKALLFSRNVVCVDLEGPKLTDLSFIDLPGLIQVAEDPTLVTLVEQLVVDHIKGNSLILVTVPMSDDIDNQRALTLARDADPQGKRTIGVITKPDVVGKGSKSRELYLDVIEGRNKALLHGYFCTRQPDDDDREKGITYDEARRAEAQYFDTNKPWCDSTHKNRFGVKNLLATLSPLLEKIIRERLPKLREETANRLMQCNRDLSSLPEVITTEPASYMLSLLNSFCDEVNDYVKGNQGRENLIQENREAFLRFKLDIRATAPNFRARTRKEGFSPFPSGSLVLSEDEAIDEDMVMDPIYLDDMQKHIERSITRELPNNVPFPAKVTLIAQSQGRWPSAADACFTRVERNVLRILLKCVAVKFGRWEYLHSHVRFCVEELVKRHFADCRAFIDAALEAERTPYTQNSHYLQSCEEKWLTRYKQSRAAGGRGSTRVSQEATAALPRGGSRASSAATPSPDPIALALQHLAAAGYTGLTASDLGKLHKADEFETEMQIMAEVRSFFQVSYKRITDYVPMFIDLKFVRGVMTDLHTFLISELKLADQDAAERCAKYLAEDPDVVSRREEVVARRTTLENVQKELNNFERSF
ncbi:hypothetical protein DENSPDRAFT_926310 [Dentipellis sp. KUC8613]|nr:hypothetical protein DENSPDRAFT_926310 [Dentipellis sp. KUC8613]